MLLCLMLAAAALGAPGALQPPPIDADPTPLTAAAPHVQEIALPDGIFWTAVALDAERVYLAGVSRAEDRSLRGSVAAIGLADHQLLWQGDFTFPDSSLHPPAQSPADLILAPDALVVDCSAGVAVLDRGSGALRWTRAGFARDERGAQSLQGVLGADSEQAFVLMHTSDDAGGRASVVSRVELASGEESARWRLTDRALLAEAVWLSAAGGAVLAQDEETVLRLPLTDGTQPTPILTLAADTETASSVLIRPTSALSPGPARSDQIAVQRRDHADPDVSVQIFDDRGQPLAETQLQRSAAHHWIEGYLGGRLWTAIEGDRSAPLSAFDAARGEFVWRRPLPRDLLAVTEGEGWIFARIGSRGGSTGLSDERYAVFDAETGDSLWSVDNPIYLSRGLDPLSGVALDGGYVAVLARSGAEESRLFLGALASR